MNKLSYGNFDVSNGDIAFSATSGYTEPTSEIERRKQLSYPLFEVKTFINNLVPVLKSGNDESTALQLVVESNNLKYRTQAGGALTKIGPTFYSGTTEPSASLGDDGDIYIMYES